MERKLASISDVASQSFDFVIIGGGVAGCVLAARLSENPNITVALLEAGNAHFDDPLIARPDGWLKQLFNPEYDWTFRTTPQTKVMNGVCTPDGKPDPSFYWSRGKGLGGSSSINFLYWTRPQRDEIEAIANLGNPGWDWKNFHEASKRVETYRKTSLNNHPEFQDLYDPNSVGHEGPVSISFTNLVSRLELPFQQALEQHGVKSLSDSLGGDLAGTFKSASSIDPRSGTRSSAAIGYLIPALDRPNLKVLTAAYVRRVITEHRTEGLVATAVEFDHAGNTYAVKVVKEAIISASTVKSPHILEMSGIGDRTILQSLGIPTKIDLPSVGTNLQDHLIVLGSLHEMKTGHGFVTTDTMASPEIQAKLRELFGESVPALACSGVTFLPLHSFSDRADTLIEQLKQRVEKAASSLPPGLKQQYEAQIDIFKNKEVPDIEILVFPINIAPDGKGKPYIGLYPSIGHPVSRGTVHATSSDPLKQPLIEPNYCADELDMEILVDSVKFIRKVTASEPWASIKVGELLPGPAVTTDEQLREHLKTNVSTSWHACGTCSMLPKDKGGVVDTHLKVYGTTNLRVVDLSILPLLTVVHTQATTYGIAEQAADIIKADNGI